MDAAAGMKKAIAERKRILGDKLAAMYDRNKVILATHRKRKEEQHQTK